MVWRMMLLTVSSITLSRLSLCITVLTKKSEPQCRRTYHAYRSYIPLLFPIESIDRCGTVKLFHITPLLLCGTPLTALPVDEAANFVQLQQLKLFRRSHILHKLRHQFGSHTFICKGQHLKRVGDRRFTNLHNLTCTEIGRASCRERV